MPADTVGKVGPSQAQYRCTSYTDFFAVDHHLQGSPLPYICCSRTSHTDLRQAAVAWEAAKDLSIEDIEVEPPKAHEVRIEIYYTGVCHTGKYRHCLGIHSDFEGVQMHTHYRERILKGPSQSFSVTKEQELLNLLAKE